MEAAVPKLKRAGDADNRGATDFIESLDRGLRVLEVFGGRQQPMTLSDLAKAARLPRATTRRILFTLERAGFVASDGKLFRLMPRVLVLASSYLASNHVVSVLQPALDLRVLGSEDGVEHGYTLSAGTSVELPLGSALLVPQAKARFGNLTVRSGAESGFIGFDVGLSIRGRRVQP